MGDFFFHNELGVRLFSLLLNTLTLVIVEKLVAKKNAPLFYVIVLSIAVLQASGFNAVPDTPLIFFTALFFWSYRKFLQHTNWANSFLLGLITAALFYSKYHGLLVVLFTVLSNLKLLTRYQTYFAGLVALLFFIPHLWWQYQHDWVSFRYQLLENNVEQYKPSFTVEYIVGQLLLPGPFAGIILLPAAFLFNARETFDRALKFTLVGIYIFFFVSSFRGSVEGNWTAPAIVPLVILSHNYFSQSASSFAIRGYKWLVRLLPVTLVLVLFARIAMIVDVLPVQAIRERFHSWHTWPQIMRQRTKGLPVVFENSYQRASKYWFYSGQITYSLNWYRERKNNYNFWPIEDSFLGKAVFLLDIYNLDSFQNKMATPIGMVGYKYDSAFSSFGKVKFIPTQTMESMEGGVRFLEMTVRAQLSQNYYNYIMTHPELQTEVIIGVFGKHGWIKDVPVEYSLMEMIQRPRLLRFLNLDLRGKDYYLIFSIYRTGNITATHNSDKIYIPAQ